MLTCGIGTLLLVIGAILLGIWFLASLLGSLFGLRWLLKNRKLAFVTKEKKTQTTTAKKPKKECNNIGNIVLMIGIVVLLAILAGVVVFTGMVGV